MFRLRLSNFWKPITSFVFTTCNGDHGSTHRTNYWNSLSNESVLPPQDSERTHSFHPFMVLNIHVLEQQQINSLLQKAYSRCVCFSQNNTLGFSALRNECVIINSLYKILNNKSILNYSRLVTRAMSVFRNFSSNNTRFSSSFLNNRSHARGTEIRSLLPVATAQQIDSFTHNSRVIKLW